jgi:hypothetical protein
MSQMARPAVLPPPPANATMTSLACEAPSLDDADRLLSTNLDCGGSAGLCPCRHHPSTAIGLLLSMWAQKEANRCHMSLGKKQGHRQEELAHRVGELQQGEEGEACHGCSCSCSCSRVCGHGGHVSEVDH